MTTEVESRVPLRAEVERSAITKAFVIRLFFDNWAATFSSMYTTALIVVGKLEANGVTTALPFSALAATPAIRSLYQLSTPRILRR